MPATTPVTAPDDSVDGGSRPVVGLTAFATRAAWGVWDTEAVLLGASYVRCVVAAGGLPVLVPPLPGLVEALLPRLDAVVLTGGQDVDPALYGQRPGEHTQVPSPERDGSELALLAGAVEARLPVLGVCRGMQVLNVARGGTLHQHLPDLVGTADHAPTPGVYARHGVGVDDGSLLSRVLGRTEVEVPTYHHQGVDRVGSGLVVSASAEDGTVEALEDPSLPFCLGVQWHPEVGEDLSLFTALVEAARRRLEAREDGAGARRSPARQG